MNIIAALTSIAAVEISIQLCTDYPIPSRSNEMVNTAIVLICVMTPFVILRLYSRSLTVMNLWWDDWMIIVAAVRIYCSIVSISWSLSDFEYRLFQLQSLV